MEALLAGVRVVDLSQGTAGAYCSKLLGQFGARVIKVEPPEGNPARRLGPFPDDLPDQERSAPFLYLNTNKESVRINLRIPEGVDAARRLAASANIVIDDFAPGSLAVTGLSFSELSRSNPGLVQTSITPFGQTGPYAEFQATHLVTCALSGALGLFGDADREPLEPGWSVGDYAAGLHAAVGTMAAHYRSQLTGLGEQIDVSSQEAQQLLTIFSALSFQESGTMPARGRWHLHDWDDGYFGCMLGMGRGWENFCEWMGRPELADDPEFAILPARLDPDFLLPLLRDQVPDLSREELFAEAQTHRVQWALVPTVEEILEIEQFGSRSYFGEVEHPVADAALYPGAPFKLGGSPAIDHRPAPLLGAHDEAVLCGELGYSVEDLQKITGAATGRPDQTGPPTVPPPPTTWPAGRTASKLPLQGIRILDATWAMAGPQATSSLANLGAEVIKVLNPSLPSAVDGFAAVNRNKYGIAINLNDPRGADLFRRLVAVSDVVAENFSSRVMGNFGLDYEDLVTVKPDVIMLSMPCFGRTGPWKDYIGSALITECTSGLPQLTGYEGGPPTLLTGFCDGLAGLQGALAVLLALEFRRRTGKGQHIDLAQTEACASLVGEQILGFQLTKSLPTRRGSRSPHMSPHGVYRCDGDDRWVAIAVRSDEEWQRFAAVLGTPAWTDDDQFHTLADRLTHQDELDAHIESWTRKRSNDSIMRLLQSAGVPAGAVLDSAALLQDSHLQERGFFQIEEGEMLWPQEPIRLSTADTRTRTATPSLGQHTSEVLHELLGLTEAELDALQHAGAISMG